MKIQKNFIMANAIRQLCLIPVVVVVTFVLFSCAPTRWANRIDWKEYELATLPGKDDFPDAGAIILLDEGKMEIAERNKTNISIFERHKIIKILDIRGQRYANIAVQYSPLSYVEKIEARTISLDGKITVLDEKNIFDINLYPNFIFYSDQRAKIFTMPAVENGSVIEYRYLLNIMNPTFGNSWSFQDNVPTLISRFSLLQPLKKEVEHRIYGINLEPMVKKAPEGFKSTHIWEARNVPPLKPEFGMPPRKEGCARLALSPLGIETWEDVAQWYHELITPQIKAGKGIKQLAFNLTKDAESDEQKLERLYEWVRDQVRYIAVAIGIGGFQPHPAEEVLKNRYGDCKDMTTLLCSLAREAGIDANEVLISTWFNGKPDTSLASPYQFNHAIAYCPSVGDSGVWMDATEKGCPFGVLPWYDQHKQVLTVDKEGKAEIIVTPGVPPDSNHLLLDWNVNLEPTGGATITGKTQFFGALATELREDLYYSSSSAHKQWLETYLAHRCSGAKLDSFQMLGLYPVSDPVTISYTFQTATFAINRAQAMVFRPCDILAFELPDYFRSSDRVHPIQFRFGSKTKLNLTVNIPDAWIADTPFTSDSLWSQFGAAFWSYSRADTTFHASATYCLNGKNILPPVYQDFQNFLDGIRRRNLQEVVITRCH